MLEAITVICLILISGVSIYTLISLRELIEQPENKNQENKLKISSDIKWTDPWVTEENEKFLKDLYPEAPTNNFEYLYNWFFKQLNNDFPEETEGKDMLRSQIEWGWVTNLSEYYHYSLYAKFRDEHDSTFKKAARFELEWDNSRNKTELPKETAQSSIPRWENWPEAKEYEEGCQKATDDEDCDFTDSDIEEETKALERIANLNLNENDHV